MIIFGRQRANTLLLDLYSPLSHTDVLLYITSMHQSIADWKTSIHPSGQTICLSEETASSHLFRVTSLQRWRLGISARPTYPTKRGTIFTSKLLMYFCVRLIALWYWFLQIIFFLNPGRSQGFLIVAFQGPFLSSLREQLFPYNQCKHK